jgi:hypothetical protein
MIDHIKVMGYVIENAYCNHFVTKIRCGYSQHLGAFAVPKCENTFSVVIDNLNIQSVLPYLGFSLMTSFTLIRWLISTSCFGAMKASLKIPTICACLDANRVNNNYNLTILFYKEIWKATTINKP